MKDTGKLIGSSRKGQVAFEFLLIYSFFIFVFTATLYILSQQAIQQQIYAEGMFAREFIVNFANEINSATLVNGYEKNFSFPNTINSAPYSVSIYNGLIRLNYTTQVEIDLIYPLATNNIFIIRNGVTKDTTTAERSVGVSDGRIRIVNEGGTVVIYDD